MIIVLILIICIIILYAISIGLYIHYLHLCKSKKIRPLNYIDWFIGEDDKL